MKKLIVLFSAVAALAACSKNETVPAVSGENVEISYKVAPRTKADPQTFDTHNVFASWAYYLPSGKNWSKNQVEAQEYISNSEISFNNSVWKNKDISYCWPKGGSLTFFAYSLNSTTLTLPEVHTSHFYCENHEDAYGIQGLLDWGKGNDITSNIDFLVADIASDKTSNVTSYYNVNGVPTLFKHRFSRVKFAVKKKADYANTTITLNSIKFNNIVNGMTYSQYRKNTESGKFEEYIYPGQNRSGMEYTKTDLKVESATGFVSIPEANEVCYICIPQNFNNVEDADKIATIEVKYTVTYKDGSSKTYTKTLKVKDIFDNWEMGKKYTFNLSFSLDEINWAPAVGDWENGNAIEIPVDGETTTEEQN